MPRVSPPIGIWNSWIWWGLWDGGMVALWYGREQKVGGRGCEGFRPFVSRRMGIKPKTSFRHYIPTLAHGGALRSPPTSLATRKKSRFAEKKSAPPKKNCAYSLLNCRVWRCRQVGHGGVFKRGGGVVEWWGLDEIVGGRDYMEEAWACLPPDSALCAIGAVFFRRSRLFVLFHPTHPTR